MALSRRACRTEIANTIQHEFELIRNKRIAPYFLTVHEIVDAGPQDGHPLPGPRLGRQLRRLLLPRHHRRSIPTRVDVLFERFLSNERDEPPDIDVDFEHERREEVIQWIYEKTAAHRAALAATVIAYRSRSAIREVGKALGLSPDTVGVMADTVWGMGSGGVDVGHVREAGLDPDRSAPDAGARTVGRAVSAFRATSRSMSAASC